MSTPHIFPTGELPALRAGGRAEPGCAYHRLGRTPAHRWWRPIVGTGVLVVGSVAAVLAVTGVALFIVYLARQPAGEGGLPTLSPLADLVTSLLAIAALLPIVLLTARWIQRRPAGSVSSVVGRLRWRWLALCLLVGAVTVVAMVAGLAGLEVVTGEPFESSDFPWVGLGEFVTTMAILVVLVPLQATAEEFAFRGWLIQAVGSVVRAPWLPIAVQAVLFALLHGVGTWSGFIDLVYFGVVTGWLAVRTGGLESTIGIHVANNLILIGLAAAFGDLALTENAAEPSWQHAIVAMVAITGYAAVVSWLARRRRIDQVVPAPADPPVATHTADVAISPGFEPSNHP